MTTASNPTVTPAAAHAHCRCGAFRFESASPPILQLVCHCSQCREVSGRPFSNFSFFKVRDTQTSGAHRTVAFTAASGARTVREVQIVIDARRVTRDDLLVLGQTLARFRGPCPAYVHVVREQYETRIALAKLPVAATHELVAALAERIAGAEARFIS